MYIPEGHIHTFTRTSLCIYIYIYIYIYIHICICKHMKIHHTYKRHIRSGIQDCRLWGLGLLHIHVAG